MVKITGRSNANDETIPQKSSLIYSDDCILTGISHLFNTLQADGECQGDLQIVRIDASIPGEELSDTVHPDTDTAHRGNKYAKFMCFENAFLSDLTAGTGSLQHHNSSLKEVKSYPTSK